MCNQMQTVRKGESFGFEFDRSGESIAGYECTIQVKRFPGDSPSIARTIPAKDGKWAGSLTSTETSLLSKLGEWMVIGVITNTADDSEDQQAIRFSLAEAL